MVDYKSHWEQKFASRSWGRYPPEELVRFIGRTYKTADPSQIRILEIGCGPGANLWFLHREGFAVAGIDASPTGIQQAGDRLRRENAGLNPVAPELRVGDFSDLPWGPDHFDCVIDIFALYANPLAVITKTLAEVKRVLKPHGLFFTKVWGQETTGYGSGVASESGTCDGITEGPCRDMGVSHFFSEPELRRLCSDFETLAVDRIDRTDHDGRIRLQEFIGLFRKTAP